MAYFLVSDSNPYGRKIIKAGSMKEGIEKLHQDRDFDISNLQKIEFLIEDVDKPEKEIKELVRDLFYDIKYLADAGWSSVENNGGYTELEAVAKSINEKSKMALNIARGLGNFKDGVFSESLK